MFNTPKETYNILKVKGCVDKELPRGKFHLSSAAGKTIKLYSMEKM